MGTKIIRPGSIINRGIIRYTDIFVTVNTNRKPYSQGEEDALYTELEHIVEDIMFTDEEIKKILPVSDPEKIIEVTMPSLSFETGKKPRGSRVHAHFILNITHSTQFHIGKANKQFKEWFDAQFSWFTGSNGCNVKVILLKTSKLKNYIAKTGKSPPEKVFDDFQ